MFGPAMQNLYILFMPFDAVKKHYRRSADEGVTPYCPDPSFAPQFADARFAEAVGTPMPVADISTDLPSIIDNVCGVMKESSSYPAEDHLRALAARKAAGHDVSYLLSHPAKTYPDVIFLSEQPKGVDFPPFIIIPGSTVVYRRIGVAGKLAVQRIYGYVREDMYSGSGATWIAKEEIKTSEKEKKPEHMLAITYTMGGKSCTFMGVHLTSGNTSLSTHSDQKAEIDNLDTFCASKGISLAIGDFNMNMKELDGHVGAAAGSTVFAAPSSFSPDGSAPCGMFWQERHSSSVDDRHYMGYRITDPDPAVTITGSGAEGVYGASGPRSLAAKYYSDHSPIALRVNFLLR